MEAFGQVQPLQHGRVIRGRERSYSVIFDVSEASPLFWGFLKIYEAPSTLFSDFQTFFSLIYFVFAYYYYFF